VSAAAALAEHYAATYPDEVARHLERLPPAEGAALVSALAPAVAAALLPHVAPAHAALILSGLTPEMASPIVAVMRTEIAASLLRRLDAPTVEALLDALPGEQAAGVRALLARAPETAGGVMDPHVLAVPATATVADARRLLEAMPQRLYYYVYIVDGDHRLAGAVDLRELLQASPADPVRSLVRPGVTWLAADAPLDSVFAHPGWRTLDAMPVVDAERRFLGVLRHRRMRELQESRQSQGGDDRAVRTVMALGEIYWLGLCGLLQGIASTATDAASEGARP
jgi:magnesium transporter